MTYSNSLVVNGRNTTLLPKCIILLIDTIMPQRNTMKAMLRKNVDIRLQIHLEKDGDGTTRHSRP